MGTLGVLDKAAAKGLIDLPSAIEGLLHTLCDAKPVKESIGERRQPKEIWVSAEVDKTINGIPLAPNVLNHSERDIWACDKLVAPPVSAAGRSSCTNSY